MPNYHRYYPNGHPVFATIVTYQRHAWLTSDANVQLLLSSIHLVKEKYPFRHIAHVILPDHVHWLFEPDGDANFSKIISAVKRSVTWRMKENGERNTISPLWQKRFYDHIIRDQEDLGRHLDYIHFNPVRHGVVKRVGEYPHSSFAEWLKRGAYDPEWGDMEPERIKDMDLE